MIQSLDDVQVNFLCILRLTQGYLRSRSVGCSTLTLIGHVPPPSTFSLPFGPTYCMYSTTTYHAFSPSQGSNQTPSNFDPSGCGKCLNLGFHVTLCYAREGTKAARMSVQALSTTLKLLLSRFRTSSLLSTSLVMPSNSDSSSTAGPAQMWPASHSFDDSDMARRLARQRQLDRSVLAPMPKP